MSGTLKKWMLTATFVACALVSQLAFAAGGDDFLLIIKNGTSTPLHIMVESFMVETWEPGREPTDEKKVWSGLLGINRTMETKIPNIKNNPMFAAGAKVQIFAPGFEEVLSGKIIKDYCDSHKKSRADGHFIPSLPNDLKFAAGYGVAGTGIAINTCRNSSAGPTPKFEFTIIKK